MFSYPDDQIIDLVNAGRLDTPYDKSYNLNDYEAILASARPAGNVSVNGTLSQADSAMSPSCLCASRSMSMRGL